MHAEANNVLPFRSHLHVVASLQAAVTHVVLFHLHKGRVRIGLGTGVPISRHGFILFVFDQSGQEVILNLFLRFFDSRASFGSGLSANI